MEIITNFHVGMSPPNSAGLGSQCTSVTTLSFTATNMAATLIGWQSNGGDTFVSANTGRNTQLLASSAMKTELVGSVALTVGYRGGISRSRQRLVVRSERGPNENEQRVIVRRVMPEAVVVS